MQDHAQETTLRVRVHGQIKHRGRLDDTVEHAFHQARRFFQHQHIDDSVAAGQENHADRPAQAGDRGSHLKVWVKDLHWPCVRVGGDARAGAENHRGGHGGCAEHRETAGQGRSR